MDTDVDMVDTLDGPVSSRESERIENVMGSDSNIFVAQKIDVPRADLPNTLVQLNKKDLTLDAKYETAYEWLYYSCSKNGYLCKVCELFSGQILHHDKRCTDSTFLYGTFLGDHPIRKLDRHQASHTHQEALKMYIKAKEVPKNLGIPEMFRKQRSSPSDISINGKYIGALVSTTNLVVHNHWSLESVSKLMKHMAESNCLDITDYTKHHQLLYTSSTSVTEILCALGQYFETILLEKIRASDYVTLLADESTDEANRNQFAILIRFLDEGTIDDHFVGLVNVKRADAATLTEAIIAFLEVKHINVDKVVFVGFDGCNTMSGELTGVQRRFRHVVPHSFYINCRSHKLALCVKHLMKDFNVFEDVDAVLLAVFKMFEYSPQKFAVFKDVQSSYAVRELVMVRAAATRWLSHGVAFRRFADRFVQILDTLDTLIQRKREPETIGLRDMVTNKTTLAAILVLCDLLQPVSLFCKYLQGSSLDFSSVAVKLKELTDSLHLLTERFRASLETPQEGLYVSKMTALFDEVDERTVFARRLRQQNPVENFIEELAVPMTQKLINELEDGFTLSPVLKAFSVLNLKYLPNLVVDLGDYGKADIETLVSHYGVTKEDTYKGQRKQAPPLFNKATALAEFEGFKHIMFCYKFFKEQQPKYRHSADLPWR